MINRRVPSALMAAALMRVVEIDDGDTELKTAGTIVLRTRDVADVYVLPTKLSETNGDAWRRQGKRRGRHAR